jgi:hypothetical protein
MLKFVMPFLRDVPENFWCSEMVANLLITIGGYKGFKNDNRTPWDLQKCKDLK